MSEKTEKRKQDLRERLTDAAHIRIERDGFRALRARDLARDAGCALGAIYNVFNDLNAIVLAVNGITFRRLGATVAQSVKGADTQSPNQRLILMSTAYLHFASTHNNLWRAVFDIQMSLDGPVPEWYVVELAKLFEHISAPLAEIFPDRDAEGLDLMTRTLFSSVHGIVLLGLERRISGVPVEEIEQMIAQLLNQIGNS
ncbi:MAG: TetR/AcrR family transcriptional regulator [Rhodobacteraceae bacterium]|nr:TetR/AcrR family transcriptional regulator [Paracoccaceae bacterium]